MGYKFTSICCNWASLTTVREPEDQGVSIAPSPLFSSRHVSETHFGLMKLLSASLLFSGEANTPSFLSIHSTEPSSPAQQPPWGFSYHFSRCSDGRGHIPLLHSQKTFRTCRPPFPADGKGHAGSGDSTAEEPLSQATLSPAEPSGEGCASMGGAREKQQSMSEAKEKTHNPTHGMSPSSVKRACCRDGVFGDCLDPISETFIACLGHL